VPSANLASVVAEVGRWCLAGQSCFTKFLKELKLPVPSKSILDAVLPHPDG
jgi:hypothetical protein